MARRKSAQNAQVKAETGQDMTTVERWIEELESSNKRFDSYDEKVLQISKRYCDEKDASASGNKKPVDRKYNVLWSVTQTMGPLVYSSAPQPYVSRRHSDADAAARDASLLLQRALTYSLDGDELHDACTEAREDYLLGSRGVIWNKYTPYLKLRESELKTYLKEGEEAPKEAEVKTDEKGSYFHKKYDEKVYEETDVEHVLYSDFRHGAAAKWKHVPWVARRVPMSRKELIKRFGEDMGKRPPLTIQCNEKTKTEDSDDAKGMFAKAEVWEIWDKCTRTVYWLCPQFKDSFLDTKEDPLELDGFFPCPRPAYSTKTNRTLVPTPDFCIWQDIAIELDDITLRLKLLTEALRVVGIYDKSAGDHMKRLFKQTAENDMIGVDNWAMYAEKGGLKGLVEFLPIEQVMMVVDKLTVARERLLRELYEITGISDIVRGASDPRETAKAQSIKGNFANKRLSDRQNTFGRMIRENLEIEAQIICRHYSDDMIRLCSSAEQILVDSKTGKFDDARFKAALFLLRSDPLRRFRIKIDEKNLASMDANEDREQRVQFTQGLSQLLQAGLPLAQQYPAAGHFLKSVILFVTRGFPLARSEEAAMEEALDNLINTKPPEEAPEQQSAGAAPKTQGEIDNDRRKIEGELEIKKREVAIKEREIALEEQKAKDEHAFRMAQLAQKDRIAAADRAAEEHNHDKDLAADAQRHARDTQIRREEGARQEAANQHAQGMDERRFGRDVQNDRQQAIAAFGQQPQQPQQQAPRRAA